jgi:hypothetical protein
MKHWRSVASWAVRAALIGVAVAAIAPLSTRAAASDAALTVTRGAEREAISLTLDELAAMPQVTIVTEHEFVDGRVAYRGPLMRDLIDRLALGQAETLRFTAANDYHVEIPVSDFRAYDAILAMEADGAPLSRREKGPLWLMYPISDHDELRDPVYVARLIWQVTGIEAP